MAPSKVNWADLGFTLREVPTERAVPMGSGSELLRMWNWKTDQLCILNKRDVAEQFCIGSYFCKRKINLSANSIIINFIK